MARIKLRQFGLDGRFAFGAFGDDGEDRNAVARVAVRRAAERTGLAPERCIVVGDTEHDITCARAAGARAVAVATGTRQRSELEPHAPDLLLDDLADPGPLLEWARTLG
jgi:phosphoglycolate phosphatase-like HAD superfamily hydrolase